MARRERTSSSLAKATGDPAGAALVMIAAPILVGGAVALAMTLRGRRLAGGWLKSIFGSAVGGGSRTKVMRDELGHYIHGDGELSALRDAVMGAGKGAVVNVFGSPRTAILGRGGSRLSIWRSDTWYYPLDRAERSALAIRFEGNVARDVEHISVPTASID